MAISVVMPALEMAQENGKLLAWRKAEGDRVSKGEPLLEIETDKAVVEVEAPGDGILAGVTAQVGAVVPVGETIAWLVAPGEAPPVTTPTMRPAARAASAGHAAAVAPPPASEKAPLAVTPPQISPKARRLAKELGLDISQICGTGPDGTITSEDVQAASQKGASGAAAVTAPATAETLSQVARLMAERTTQSWTSVPHFFLVKSVDAGKLLEAQRKFGKGVTITDVLVALIGRVLAKHPQMNASWTGRAVRQNPDIHVSVAMAVKDGVVGAVIPKADSAAVNAISQLRRELTERARAGKLRPADIAGGTFTLSNLGMYQMDAFSAIITPPQAAVLAVGAIADAVVVVDGKPAVRPMVSMTLSSDHRVVDGARAAEFLAMLAGAIGEPEKWIE
jgi:pyruvate dehydrogenase E2 component (dihydrolipoamide acetyltransferase)